MSGRNICEGNRESLEPVSCNQLLDFYIPELDLFRHALLENPLPTAVLGSSALISTSEFPFGLQMLLYVL